MINGKPEPWEKYLTNNKKIGEAVSVWIIKNAALFLGETEGKRFKANFYALLLPQKKREC